MLECPQKDPIKTRLEVDISCVQRDKHVNIVSASKQ